MQACSKCGQDQGGATALITVAILENGCHVDVENASGNSGLVSFTFAKSGT